ncbi:MAG: MotA/TolQ/ExbB proton channel family protein [Deltaproteobacteria bacterium]|nr:MotA/TolQ/ExbB proton channel family protein [Deltaproteobacteria bacterium]
MVVWAGLTVLLYKTSAFFREGGWGMWPILLVGMIFVLITIDRVRYLYLSSRLDQRQFMARIQRHLMQGDVQGAAQACQNDGDPLAKIVGAGLLNMHRPDHEVQEAVDEAALYELPRLEQRTGYLAMIGNIATLLGLLGTIVGLITSFAGVSLDKEKDPATQKRAEHYVYLVPACQPFLGKPVALVQCIKGNKATILARGISEAMHCTAFGLLVGILALLAFSFLNGRTQRMLDNASDGAVQLVNLAVGHRSAMKLDFLKG